MDPASGAAEPWAKAMQSMSQYPVGEPPWPEAVGRSEWREEKIGHGVL
ncbi:hypothetical protein SynMINOS11_01951 [Synechococcus sp. Minos11]|nr:hypothetical protein SynMINOS11_01951 [Synechococcus sp. Minos11]